MSWLTKLFLPDDAQRISDDADAAIDASFKRPSAAGRYDAAWWEKHQANLNAPTSNYHTDVEKQLSDAFTGRDDDRPGFGTFLFDLFVFALILGAGWLFASLGGFSWAQTQRKNPWAIAGVIAGVGLWLWLAWTYGRKVVTDLKSITTLSLSLFG